MCIYHPRNCRTNMNPLRHRRRKRVVSCQAFVVMQVYKWCKYICDASIYICLCLDSWSAESTSIFTHILMEMNSQGILDCLPSAGGSSYRWACRWSKHNGKGAAVVETMSNIFLLGCAGLSCASQWCSLFPISYFRGSGILQWSWCKRVDTGRGEAARHFFWYIP